MHGVSQVAKTTARKAKAGQESLQDDQFDRITKGDVEKRAYSVAHFARYRLGCITEQPCKRDDGNSVDTKDGTRRHAGDLSDGDADGDKDEPDVEPRVEDDFLAPEIEADGDVWLLSRGLGGGSYDNPRARRLRCLEGVGVAVVIEAGICRRLFREGAMSGSVVGALGSRVVG